MKKINSIEEFYQVIEGNGTKFIYFYTNWCPDCFVIKPHLPRLEDEYKDIEFYMMDRDVDIDLARHLNIFGIPSFLMYKDGVEADRFVSKKRKTYIEVKGFIDSVIG
jgi:thiol-disulfide isomerase/thioredoxin